MLTAVIFSEKFFAAVNLSAYRQRRERAEICGRQNLNPAH
jgi:hypothetical protein